MSYSTWNEYGYGFCMSKLSEEAINKIYKHFHMSVDDDEQDLGEHIANELNNLTQVNGFMFCFDFDGNMYIMYGAGYPWHMKDKDKMMTEQGVKHIINKYMRMVGINDFNDNIIDYQSVENGG